MTSTTYTPGKRVVDQGDGRVDYRISDKDSLFGSLSWSNAGRTDGAPFPGPSTARRLTALGETDLAATRR